MCNQRLDSTLDSTATPRKPDRACTAGGSAPSGAALPPYSPRKGEQNLSDYSTVVSSRRERGVESVESRRPNPAVRVAVLAGAVMCRLGRHRWKPILRGYRLPETDAEAIRLARDLARTPVGRSFGSGCVWLHFWSRCTRCGKLARFT